MKDASPPPRFTVPQAIEYANNISDLYGLYFKGCLLTLVTAAEASLAAPEHVCAPDEGMCTAPTWRRLAAPLAPETERCHVLYDNGTKRCYEALPCPYHSAPALAPEPRCATCGHHQNSHRRNPNDQGLRPCFQCVSCRDYEYVPDDKPAPEPSGRMTRQQFGLLVDRATAYLVADDTTTAQMKQVQDYYDQLVAHDAALRAEVENTRRVMQAIIDGTREARDKAEDEVERLNWENGIMRNHDCLAEDAERDEQRDAAIAERDALAERVKTLDKLLSQTAYYMLPTDAEEILAAAVLDAGKP